MKTIDAYIPKLRHTKLFSGVGEEEILAMVNCLGFKIGEIKKGEYVFRAGEHIHEVALLVEGSLFIQKDDYWGNRSVINKVVAGDTFGEAYAMPDSEVLLNDILALEDSVVLFFDINRVLTVCSNSCKFHTRIIQNLLQSISARNRMLTQKINYMAQRSLRDKLIAYLSAQSQLNGSSSFDIPFNRQQLADFLSVDRSAMSNELCKMRDAGMLRFSHNHFELIY